MGFIQNLFSGGASQVINSVGSVLDKVITTKSEKMQLALEMKKAENQYNLDMANLSLEERKALLGDVASARTMNAAVQESANATRLAKNVSPLLALGASLITFCLFGLLMFGPAVDQNKREMILYVLGILSAVLTQIFGFYFGSSQGSAEKSKSIQDMHEKMMQVKS